MLLLVAPGGHYTSKIVIFDGFRSFSPLAALRVSLPFEIKNHDFLLQKIVWFSGRSLKSECHVCLNTLHVSYIFKLARANGHFVKKIRSRTGSNLLVEHHFAHRGPPPEHVVNFKPFSLGGYLDSDGIPHHSSDVFRHGESISDRITDVRALYPSTSGRFSQTSVFLKVFALFRRFFVCEADVFKKCLPKHLTNLHLSVLASCRSFSLQRISYGWQSSCMYT